MCVNFNTIYRPKSVQRKKFIHLAQRAMKAVASNRQSRATPPSHQNPFNSAPHSMCRAFRAHFAHKWSQFELHVPWVSSLDLILILVPAHRINWIFFPFSAGSLATVWLQKWIRLN